MDPLQVDFASRRVLRDGNEVSLTPTEYDLLKAFITHRGKILTRQQLLKLVWGTEANVGIHSLHVYVAQLRRKVETIPEHPRFLLTIPGVGYRFSDEPDGEHEKTLSEI
jgi:two-component system KDP operon response regulator KdpE